MARDWYYPDAKKLPHIHYHNFGVTFANTRHHHKELFQHGERLDANIQAVLADLQFRSDTRSQLLVQHIQTEL